MRRQGPALTACCEQGCPNLTRSSYCTAHHRDDPRPDSTARGYDHRWARKSRAFLADHKWCRRCGKRAQHVHHRDHLGPLGPHGYDDDNLESLCHSCHSSETAQQPRTRR